MLIFSQLNETIWRNHQAAMGKTCDSNLEGANVEILKKATDKKCYQCDYASSSTSHLKRHLKIHSGEKSNKCSQCDSKFSQADNLRTHLKIHSGEKLNKCNQCDFASVQAGDLRTHLKTHLK